MSRNHKVAAIGGFQIGAEAKYTKVGEEHFEDVGQKNRRDKSNKYVRLCAIFASLNSILLGYDIGVMSGAIIYIQKDLHISEVQQEILVGCLSIVSLFGSLAGGRTSDIIGRRWTLGLAAIIFQTGALIMALAPSFPVLMFGRLFSGLGVGFGLMIAPVYIAEVSPTTARGSFTSFPEIFTNAGILLGYISNYAFSGLPAHVSWRLMLGVVTLPSVFIGIALFMIPESPRWLVMQRRRQEARSVLTNIMPNEDEVEQKLAEIVESASLEKQHEEQKQVWHELLNPTPPVRRMLIAGCGVQCFQQITGIDATVYYSPKIFGDAGIKSDKELLASTVGVGFMKTLFILVAIFLIDRVGRKPLLYISTIGMTVSLLTLGLSLTLLKYEVVSSKFGIGLAICGVCGNVAFFSMGIGPICWVITSEVFPLRLRAQASALGAVGNRVSSGVIAMSFLSVARAISMAGVFFIFSAVSAVSVGFVHNFVPETKGKTLEEIEMLFQDVTGYQKGGVELGEADEYRTEL